MTVLFLNYDYRKILSQPFRPGKLLKDFEAAGIETGVEGYDLVHVLMTNSHQIFAAQYAQNGKCFSLVCKMSTW